MAASIKSINYRRMLPITKSDSVDVIGGVCNAIMISGVGNLVVIDGDGNQTTLTAIPVGTIIPVAVRRVNATGSTATAVALYR